MARHLLGALDVVQESRDGSGRAVRVGAAAEATGRYVYCLASPGEAVDLGEIGIEERRVYTILQGDLCAVVHGGPPQPYSTGGREMTIAWVVAHHRVVDAAWKRWGAVIPMAFNTIVAPGEKGAEENLREWLERERASLRGRFRALAGKAEYAVQLFLDVALLTREVAAASPETKKLEETIAGMPRGLAYMERRRLENLLKRETETRVEAHCTELYSTLSRCADGVRVEKTKQSGEGTAMLMNLSCLVSPEGYLRLAAELDRVGEAQGFAVRLVGPLPPYSFC